MITNSKKLLSLCMIILLSFTGCVVNNKDTEYLSESEVNTNSSIDTTEDIAINLAKEKVDKLGENVRIIATSPAVADICDKLELPLVGVCTTSVSTIPARYENVTSVGTAMSPDMEVVASLSPDWILSPRSLQSDLQPKYDAISSDWAFLNLSSVDGMYASIAELGKIFNREEQAEKLVNDYLVFYNMYKEQNEGKEKKKVLILMGLPGSYIIATENSYVGSLVKMAGGENVYSGTDEEFLTVNTEDMKTKEPDIILCTAHAMPEQVTNMFVEDFATNDIWKHFKAVNDGEVHYLTYELFGMSATFRYKEALEELQTLLYSD